MPIAYPIIARLAKVRISGLPIISNEWSLEPQVDTIDVSNFESVVAGQYGYKDYVNGLRGAQITVQGWLSSQVNYFEGGYNLVDGAYVNELKLYTNDLASPFWRFPTVLVNKVSVNAKVLDIMRSTFSFMNRGEYFYPSGT